ncbi:MAG: hypothetical protein J0L63_21235 [Anaerolineae bacterium]|nr:hypothetical protein [Anaerolineae bacterium]
MPVRMFWEDEREEILRYELEGDWTWEEAYTQYDRAMVPESDYPYRVDVIMHFFSGSRLPADAMLHMATMAQQQPENIGLIVLVTTHDMLRRMVTTAAKLYPHTQRYYRVATTLNEAHSIIVRDRAASGA